jgi:hypothetical protein
MLFAKIRSSQIAASVLAFTLTALPLIGLYLFRSQTASLESPTRTTFIPILTVRSQVCPASEQRGRKAGKVRARVRAASTQSVDDYSPVSPTDSEQVSRAPESGSVIPPDVQSSGPMRLDASVVERAARASKSEIRRMADASGAYIGDKPIAQSERLASSMARSAKPDCLAPNSGGSVLSIFVIAYMAAAEKCN